MVFLGGFPSGHLITVASFKTISSTCCWVEWMEERRYSVIFCDGGYLQQSPMLSAALL
jgi:hypothetical protein